MKRSLLDRAREARAAHEAAKAAQDDPPAEQPLSTEQPKAGLTREEELQAWRERLAKMGVRGATDEVQAPRYVLPKPGVVITEWHGVLGIAILAVIGAFMFANRDRTPAPLGEAAALTMCTQAIRWHLRDPDGADIPFVNSFGQKGEFYFAWGASTRYMRVRNGLGLEVPASGYCIVDATTERITRLSLNAEDVPIPNIRRPR